MGIKELLAPFSNQCNWAGAGAYNPARASYSLVPMQNQQFVMVCLTKRFYVAVRLLSNRSQMTSKCAYNKEVAHEPQASESLMFENRCFLAWGFMMLLCSFTKKKTGSQWQDLAVFFPPSVTSLSNMLWLRVVKYPERGTLLNVSRSGYIWF